MNKIKIKRSTVEWLKTMPLKTMGVVLLGLVLILGLSACGTVKSITDPVGV